MPLVAIVLVWGLMILIHLGWYLRNTLRPTVLRFKSVNFFSLINPEMGHTLFFGVIFEQAVE